MRLLLPLPAPPPAPASPFAAPMARLPMVGATDGTQLRFNNHLGSNKYLLWLSCSLNTITLSFLKYLIRWLSYSLLWKTYINGEFPSRVLVMMGKPPDASKDHFNRILSQGTRNQSFGCSWRFSSFFTQPMDFWQYFNGLDGSGTKAGSEWMCWKSAIRSVDTARITSIVQLPTNLI